jgi:alanyl-tRNA synthetase
VLRGEFFTMTEKLFWQDPYQRQFTASVLEQFDVPDGHGVVLDQTCFYGTSGGQPNDLGTINGIAVRDVQEEQSRIIHILSARLRDNKAEGVIDWPRRFDHMQQHSGQHILSAAFFGLFRAETSSFHLGEDYCSIELSKPGLKEQELQQAEDAANEVITSVIPVTTFFIDPSRASEYPLRKKSDLAESLRLVQIGDFDLSPCSGTHVRNTGEAGGVFITGYERLSQTIKVNFLCGARIRRRYHMDLAILKSLSKSLTTSFELLPDSIARLQSQAKDLRKELSHLKEEHLKMEAVKIFDDAKEANGLRLILLADDRPYQDVRFLAQKLAEREGAVGAVLSLPDRRGVFFKNRAAAFDLKQPFTRFLERTGAKGGGPPHFMEAGGFISSADLSAMLSEVFSL